MSACRHEARAVALALADPTRADDAHVGTCAACAQAVDAARSWEAALHAGVRTLVLEVLPPAPRLGVDRRGPVRAAHLGRLTLRAPSAVLAAFATLALVIGLALRFAPAAQPGIGGPNAAGSPAPGTIASPRPSASPAGSARPAASASARPGSSQRPAASPAPSASAACTEAFAVVVKAWAGTGLPPYASGSAGKPFILKYQVILAKAFAICSAGELRSVNVRLTYSYGMKVPGASKVRIVEVPVLGDFDGAIKILCTDPKVAGTLTCMTYAAGASPPASGSP